VTVRLPSVQVLFVTLGGPNTYRELVGEMVACICVISGKIAEIMQCLLMHIAL